MATFMLGKDAVRRYGSCKHRKDKEHCEVCGVEMNPYEWYEITLTLASPYERLYHNISVRLSELDEENPRYDVNSPIVKCDVIYPDWHRNRQSHAYYCKDCAKKVIEDCLKILPKSTNRAYLNDR